jgi:outer membrane protein assembly factor BamB
VDTLRNTVFFLGWNHDVVALDATTGRIKWRNKTYVSSGRAFGRNMTVIGDVVAVGDDYVFAFQASTAQKLWQRDGGTRDIASDRRAFYLSYGGYITKVDPITGVELWSRNVAPTDTAVVAFHPAVVDGRVFVCANRYDGPRGRGMLVALSASTGDVLWRYHYAPEAGPTWCFDAVASINGLVVQAITDQRVVAHDPVTGQVRWSVSVPNRGGLSWAVSDGTHLVVTLMSAERILRLNPVDGSTMWSTYFPGSLLAPGVMADGVLLLTNFPPVVAYDLATGAVLWVRPDTTQYSIGGSPPYYVYGPPNIHNGVAYWIATDGIRARRLQ